MSVVDDLKEVSHKDASAFDSVYFRFLVIGMLFVVNVLLLDALEETLDGGGGGHADHHVAQGGGGGGGGSVGGHGGDGVSRDVVLSRVLLDLKFNEKTTEQLLQAARDGGRQRLSCRDAVRERLGQLMVCCRDSHWLRLLGQ